MSQLNRFLALLAVFVGHCAQAQVLFYEDFRPPLTSQGTYPGLEGVDLCQPGNGGAGTYPFLPNWLRRNVDNRVPDATVAYVNDAWIIRDDFRGDQRQCVAFSNSYYAPTGNADDWMWTPAIAIPASDVFLSWRASSYDPAFLDGYEVRVMLASAGPPTGGLGAIGNQLSASTPIFNTAAASASWTEYRINLSAFANQSIYIGFRNNSNDKFVLVIDDLKVERVAANLSANFAVPVLPYSRVPVGLNYLADLGAVARNTGAIVLTNVVASASLLRGGVEIAPSTQSNVIATLPLETSRQLLFPGALALPSTAGEWRVRYRVSAAEAEPADNLADNVLDSSPVQIGNELARHEDAVNIAIGVGAGNGGEMGSQFSLPNALRLVGIRFSMSEVNLKLQPQWLSYRLSANLRAFDSVTNKPGAIIASTVSIATRVDAQTYDLEFADGPLTLPAGTYVATVVEPVGMDATLRLNLHHERFVPGTQWVNWPSAPSGDWANLESFGNNFARTTAVSLLTSLRLFGDGFEGPSTGTANATGSALARAESTRAGVRAERLAGAGE